MEILKLTFHILFHYPLMCILGFGVTYFAIKQVTTNKGTGKNRILGENLTELQAKKLVSNDSNNYEFEETIDHKYPNGQQFSGKTKNDTWITWTINKEENE